MPYLISVALLVAEFNAVKQTEITEVTQVLIMTMNVYTL